MFDTYKEAKGYAELRKSGQSDYAGYILMKEGEHGAQFNTAKDMDEVKCAESLGWMLIEETRGLGGQRKLLMKRYDAFRYMLASEGGNVFSVGTQAIMYDTYFYIILKK